MPPLIIGAHFTLRVGCIEDDRVLATQALEHAQVGVRLVRTLVHSPPIRDIEPIVNAGICAYVHVLILHRALVIILIYRRPLQEQRLSANLALHHRARLIVVVDVDRVRPTFAVVARASAAPTHVNIDAFRNLA